MRTATRIALVAMGTAIFVGAMATPGARAERSPLADKKPDPLAETTASQRAQQQPRPDRMDYVRATEVMSFATAIARLPTAPESANARRGHDQRVSKLALAKAADKAKSRSVAWLDACGLAPFAAQQINASDGGRSALTGAADEASCIEEGKPDRNMREIVIGDIKQMQAQPTEPTPVVIRFEAVIRIDLAGLGW